MMAGGHFASDVLWAGLIVWLVALCGYSLFSAGKPIEIPILSSTEQKKKAKRITLFMGVLLPVITLGLMLATPYISSKEFHLTKAEFARIGPSAILFDLGNSTVRMVPDTAFRLEYRVNAFGFPNSKLRGRWTEGDTCRYVFETMGWFTELKNDARLKIPLADSCTFLIRINNGRIINDLPEAYHCEKIILPGNRVFLSVKRKKPG